VCHHESVCPAGARTDSSDGNPRSTAKAICVWESLPECLSHPNLSLTILSERNNWWELFCRFFDTYLSFEFLESPEPQQCTDEQCQEPECQYNMQQHQLAQEQLALQQQQMQNERFQLHQHQLIQPIQTQPHIHQIHYTYSRRTSLDSNALDVRYLSLLRFQKYSLLLIFHISAVRAWACFFNCCFIADESIDGHYLSCGAAFDSIGE
jgi:hypothetical protein